MGKVVKRLAEGWAQGCPVEGVLRKKNRHWNMDFGFERYKGPYVLRGMSPDILLISAQTSPSHWLDK